MERAEDLDVRSQVLHPGYPERELEVKQMKHENVKKMVALALLAALVVVLQTVASGIKVGPIPITLTLVPIVIGAVGGRKSTGRF